MKVSWFVFVSLLGLLPSLGIAQQRQPPGTARPSGGEYRALSEGPTAPLPSPVPAEPVSVSADEPGSTAGLTLAELEQKAQSCNPTLAQAAARVQAARGQQFQAGLYPNPVIGYQASEIGDDRRAGQQGGFIGQEIVTAGKLRLARAVAGEEIRQAQCAWAAQRFRVLTDVRRAFDDVLVAQRTVELAEQLVAIGQRGVRAAEELLMAKEVARADVLQARIEADSAKIVSEKSRNRHTAAWRNLAAVVGDPGLHPTRLAGGLQDGMVQFTWESALERLLAESPELAGAEAGLALAQAALRRECAGRIPNVELQASLQYDNATRDTIAGVQVGVPIPIYNRNQGNIVKAQAELAAAQHEVRRVRLALEQRLAAVFEQYATAGQQVEKYSRDIMPNAQESLKLVTAGYRQGEFGYLVLLTAQRTYFQTNLAYLDALRDLRAATAAMEGHLLSDSLQGGESPSGGAQQR
jgi:outer membrane protein, heavy metal efflux system